MPAYVYMTGEFAYVWRTAFVVIDRNKTIPTAIKFNQQVRLKYKAECGFWEAMDLLYPHVLVLSVYLVLKITINKCTDGLVVENQKIKRYDIQQAINLGGDSGFGDGECQQRCHNPQ